MQFYSTNNKQLRVDLAEAVIRSLPADNGLYMPESITPLPDSFWENWKDLSLAEMGFQVAQQIFGDSIPAADLKQIVASAITFDAPLVELNAQTSVLELFHGPTLAFKDFGARFMAQTMSYLTKEKEEKLTVLVAVEGTEVIILYPKGGVSLLQEKQLTTLGGNITALEIEGTFDDCQRMVKAAFIDRELSEKYNLTSANSINISRLVPQMFYYFNAVRNMPAGNFGNLTAGLLAQKLGLPIRNFVAATNANDVVPRYLADGNYEPVPSVATISNAMDVGAPSNFARMKELFEDNWDAMRENVSGVAYSDDETREEIKRVKEQHNYVMCPHTAVASLAERSWAEASPDTHNIILSTAHPSKFLPTMEEELGEGNIEIPERLACLAEIEKLAISMQAEDQALKDFLANR